MDWQGQKLAEQLMQIQLVGFAVVAFATGYATGSFQRMLLVYAAGVVITTLVTVPNWPLFNRHPLNWLDPSEAEKHPKPQVANSSSKKNTSKNLAEVSREVEYIFLAFSLDGVGVFKEHVYNVWETVKDSGYGSAPLCVLENGEGLQVWYVLGNELAMVGGKGPWEEDP